MTSRALSSAEVPRATSTETESPAGLRPKFLSGHLPALDGIRGLAILAVMIFHFVAFGGMTPVHIVDDLMFRGAMLGWTGVELFFVLSGFLITGILLDARGKAGYFRTFYARRSIRIFPLYFGALLLTYFVLRPLLPGYADLRAANEGSPLWFWLYGSNILTAIDGWSAVPRVLQHFWSLAIEEQFYLVWPFLVYFCSRQTMRRICVALIAAGLIVRVYLHSRGMDLGAYVLTPARMDGLAIGALVAVVMREPALLALLQRYVTRVLYGSFALIAALIVWRRGFSQFDPVIGTIGCTLVGVAFASLLFTAITPGNSLRAGKFFERRSLRFLGKYSYALYVFHQPVALALAALGLSAASFPSVAGSMLPGGVAFILIAGSISVVLALLSWNLVEKRFLQLKERFSQDAAAHPHPVAPAVSLPLAPAHSRAELAVRD